MQPFISNRSQIGISLHNSFPDFQLPPITLEHEFDSILEYFKVKFKECQKGFPSNDIQMLPLPSQGGVLPTFTNLRFDNWERFENRLKHFSQIYHALKQNNRDEIKQLMDNIPGTQKRYTEKILTLQKKLDDILGKKQPIEKHIEEFENKLQKFIDEGGVDSYPYIMLKTVIATPEDCIGYVFRIMRGGIKKFTAPSEGGFLRRQLLKTDFSEIISELKLIGFDPNYFDANRHTVLHGTIMKTNQSAAIALIEHSSIELGTTDNYKRTPLHYASEFGMLEVVKTLLKHANAERPVYIEAKDLKGKQAIELANDKIKTADEKKKKDYKRIKKLLIKRENGVMETISSGRNSNRKNEVKNLKIEDVKKGSQLSNSTTQNKKENFARIGLYHKDFELCETDRDGNCFFHAFLGSYQDINLNIPELEQQNNKIKFLRNKVAELYETYFPTLEGIERANTIRRDGEWLHGNEGDLLAKVLQIPIRQWIVNNDDSIVDILTFSEDKDRQEWSTIKRDQRPEKYIFIVDLGGHFVFARKKVKIDVAKPHSKRIIQEASQLEKIQEELRELNSEFRETKQMFQKDIDELTEVNIERIAFHRDYEAANLNTYQKMYYDMLSKNIAFLLRDMQPSLLRNIEPQAVAQIVGITSSSAQYKNSGHKAISKANKTTEILEHTSHAMENVLENVGNGLDYLINSETLVSLINDASRCLSVTHFIVNIVTKRVENRFKKRVREATGEASQCFSRNSLQALDMFAQYLALEMAKRLGDMLKLIKYKEYEKLVNCTMYRLAASLFNKKINIEDGVPQICDKLCNLGAKQDSVILGIFPRAMKIELESYRMEEKFTPGKKKIPRSIDENIIFLGFETCQEYLKEHYDLKLMDLSNAPISVPQPIAASDLAAPAAKSFDPLSNLEESLYDLQLKNNVQQKQIEKLTRIVKSQERKFNKILEMQKLDFEEKLQTLMKEFPSTYIAGAQNQKGKIK